jgi:hypothetical protein
MTAEREDSALDDLTEYGSHGYQWTIQAPWQTKPTNMRTNQSGEGVWHEQVEESGLAEWKQTLGTGQFKLRGTLGQIKNQIRQYHGARCQWVS